MPNIPDDIFITGPQQPVQKSKIAILTADGTEDQEFFYPYYRFLEEGYKVDVLTPEGGEFKGKNGAGLKSTMPVGDANPEDYAFLYIPGGKAPEALKDVEDAVAFVQEFCDSGKPVGAICHGPQLLAEAGVIDGLTISAWPECRAEIEEAGGVYKNSECVHDGQFITGRWPADLPAQMKIVMQALKSSLKPQSVAA